MPYLARTLIARAYALSGIVSRGFQEVSGAQATEGLSLLNAVLAIKTASNRLIPYYQLTHFDAVIGQEEYFIENLIEVQSLTFNLGDVRYSMEYYNRIKYFSQPRVDNINSLPTTYFVDRSTGGATVYVYFLPSQEYIFNLYGKFSLSSVTLDQDLELTLDKFYIEYLRYALAEYIAAEYGITLQPQTYQKLKEYEDKITDIAPIDLTIAKATTLSSEQGLNWGDVNIGKGWRP